METGTFFYGIILDCAYVQDFFLVFFFLSFVWYSHTLSLIFFSLFHTLRVSFLTLRQGSPKTPAQDFNAIMFFREDID